MDDIPFGEPIHLYDYDVINGFKKSEGFSKQSLQFLNSMALGGEYVEDQNPEFAGVYTRVDGSEGWYREFYFKGTEITAAFLDLNVTIPPCLEKFKHIAERRLKIKAEKRAKENEKLNAIEVSRDELEDEIKRLKSEIERLSTQLPSLLGEFRSDDPLLIAIQLRNAEWARYDEDNRKTIPSQEALVAQLKQQYQKMPDAQARAIEKVACPIKRK
ncbi:hypothetical protein AAEY27_04285 [Kosakonia sp. BYX6]|uniref:Uncharacterized protein n=1 Tax=Kosakonia calanthes TaxID=3139408 RepID=A0ABZ3B7H6_9ENTR